MESIRQQMIRRTSILLTLALAVACSAGAPLSEQTVKSEITRCPEASYIDGQEGKLKWNYTTGLELKAFLDACPEDEAILNYVDAWYDAIIDSTGKIGANYRFNNFTLDHICPGFTLFPLYDKTGKEKYRAAMDSLYLQIKSQPRNKYEGFWHKRVYPNQMWLDGLYMAEPFYAEYTVRYIDDPLQRKRNFTDIAVQFILAWEKCYDEETGLPRHAWDASCYMGWSNPHTGKSEHAWGRACGWYAMALVEVISILPKGEDRDALLGILERLCTAIMKYTDPETGMWYQVLDEPEREGNYVEATASAMFTYVLLKATREGWIKGVSRSKALAKYRSLVKTFVTFGEDGLVNLNQCCEVAGLGGGRDGSFEYYIGENIVSNDPKGIGPLIWASLEYEKK